MVFTYADVFQVEAFARFKVSMSTPKHEKIFDSIYEYKHIFEVRINNLWVTYMKGALVYMCIPYKLATTN